MKKASLTILILLTGLTLFAQHNYDGQSVIYSKNGNLGLGTNSPSSFGTDQPTLDLRGQRTQRTGSIMGQSSDRSIGWSMGRADDSSLPDGLVIRTIDAAAINFQTGGNNTRLSISNTGNIGIGTIAPTQKLQVEGSVLLKSDSYVNYAIERGNGAKSTFGITSNTHDGFLSSSGNLKFLTNNDGSTYTTSMFLTSNGNIGIGTINPGSYKLAVKGKIRAEEIKVETGWADYVFEENYDLPTLEEVEQHIKEKGHLINIPSAQEVEENGIQLGEMNKLLLEKIEELTLYTIALEKKVNSYEERFTKLENLLKIRQ